MAVASRHTGKYTIKNTTIDLIQEGTKVRFKSDISRYSKSLCGYPEVGSIIITKRMELRLGHVFTVDTVCTHDNTFTISDDIGGAGFWWPLEIIEEILL